MKGRSPHGERGLKLPRDAHPHEKRQSLPTRGAWIEMGTEKGNGVGELWCMF